MSDGVWLRVRMSRVDADVFIDDWLRRPDAPILTGGYQENTVRVLEIRDDERMLARGS